MRRRSGGAARYDARYSSSTSLNITRAPRAMVLLSPINYAAGTRSASRTGPPKPAWAASRLCSIPVASKKSLTRQANSRLLRGTLALKFTLRMPLDCTANSACRSVPLLRDIHETTADFTLRAGELSALAVALRDGHLDGRRGHVGRGDDLARHQCRTQSRDRAVPAHRSDLDPHGAIGGLCRRRHQLDFRRARRLPRLRQIHAALRAGKSRQGQAAQRKAGARAGRAVPDRRNVSVLLQCHVRARIRVETLPRARLQCAGARRGNRSQPAVRLCRRLRRAVVDAMGAAEADRESLSRKPAHEQPRHRARLYRVGQRLFRQQLQSPTLACSASSPGCAKDWSRRSAPSWRAKA